MRTPTSAIVEHFMSQYREGDLKGPIEVPEWDDLKIYYRPVMTSAELQKINAYLYKSEQEAYICCTVITKALNEKGARIWKDADMKVFMNNADPSIIARIYDQMSAGGAIRMKGKM